MSGSPPPELDSRPQSRREWSGYLTSLVLPLAFVVAVIGGLLYWQTRDGGAGSNGDFGTVALPADRNPTDEPAAPTVGNAAPDFELPALDGAALRRSDLQGSPVVVAFWASWCVSCRANMSLLVDAYEDGSDVGLRVLALNLAEARQPMEAFVTEFDLPFDVLQDRSGEVARTWRIDGPSDGLPSTYFIDSSGVVRSVVHGPLSGSVLEEALSLILGGK